jgi:hypothetical protein
MQKTELATSLVETAQKRVAAEQQVKVENVDSAKVDLAEAEQAAAAVSAGSPAVEGGVDGSAEALAKVAEAQQQLAAAQAEMAGLREHEAELEARREALEAEKKEMEAVLGEQAQVATATASTLKAEVARLEAAGKASTESLQKQKVMSDGAQFKTPFVSHLCLKTIILSRQAQDQHRESTQKHRFLSGVVGRLQGDLTAAQTELTAAQAVVKRPPAGRRPSDKKADREKVAVRKEKRIFLRRHFAPLYVLKMIIILPRQAQDKHRESTQPKRVLRFPLQAIKAKIESLNLSIQQVRKRHFGAIFYSKMIILPRQARDKHRKNSQKSDAFPCS